jgi:Ala-tRNA(Pro) deacylase
MGESESSDAGRGMHGVDAVRHFLEREGAGCEVVTHEDTFAAAREAEAAGVDAGQTAKTVLLHDHGGFSTAVIPASERLDLHKARALLEATSHLRLATEEEMAEEFPVFDPGALPPFAALLATPQVVDRRLMEHDRILCSGGDHQHSLLISPRELERLGAPLVGDICQD